MDRYSVALQLCLVTSLMSSYIGQSVRHLNQFAHTIRLHQGRYGQPTRSNPTRYAYGNSAKHVPTSRALSQMKYIRYDEPPVTVIQTPEMSVPVYYCQKVSKPCIRKIVVVRKRKWCIYRGRVIQRIFPQREKLCCTGYNGPQCDIHEVCSKHSEDSDFYINSHPREMTQSTQTKDPWKSPVKGEKGDRGFPGGLGRRGQTGEPGTRGQKGEPGIQGRKGDRGERGLQGVTGMRGADGRDGSPGFPGLPGPPGRIANVCPCSDLKARIKVLEKQIQHILHKTTAQTGGHRTGVVIANSTSETPARPQSNRPEPQTPPSSNTTVTTAPTPDAPTQETVDKKSTLTTDVTVTNTTRKMNVTTVDSVSVQSPVKPRSQSDLTTSGYQTTAFYDLNEDEFTTSSGDLEMQEIKEPKRNDVPAFPSTETSHKDEKMNLPSCPPLRSQEDNGLPISVCNTTFMCFLPKPVIINPPTLPPPNSTSYPGVLGHIQTLLLNTERCESVKFALHFYNLNI